MSPTEKKKENKKRGTMDTKEVRNDLRTPESEAGRRSKQIHRQKGEHDDPIRFQPVPH